MIAFVSDLHLCSSRPETTRIFLRFLEGPAQRAETLCILGDLFEYWAGDDDLDDAWNASIAVALARCARSTRVLLMRGNRDFLLGAGFSRASGVVLVEDPLLIDVHGTPTLATHGDALCTADIEYQRFRAEVRSPGWQREFLALPLAERRRQIELLRSRSEREKKSKSAQIMDVEPSAVEALLRERGYPRLIHGHTHRPAHHLHELDGRRCERWVLGDWYGAGSYLACDRDGCRAVAL